MTRLWILLAVAGGGACGALARYGLNRLNGGTDTFPWGTFCANVIGCLLIGFCYQAFGQRISPIVRQGVIVGFIGALTTFSTYCLETRNLADGRQFLTAGLNTVGSVVVGLMAVYAGIALAKMVFGEQA